MSQEANDDAAAVLPGQGGNDLAGEREQRNPTAGQPRAVGSRGRDAEMKLEHNQKEARLRDRGNYPDRDD